MKTKKIDSIKLKSGLWFFCKIQDSYYIFTNYRHQRMVINDAQLTKIGLITSKQRVSKLEKIGL